MHIWYESICSVTVPTMLLAGVMCLHGTYTCSLKMPYPIWLFEVQAMVGEVSLDAFLADRRAIECPSRFDQVLE